MATLSSSTIRKMVNGRAPSALQIPNSLVRSFTVISIMLLTPISSVQIPMIQSAVFRIRTALSICIFWVILFQKKIPLGSSGLKSLRTPVIRRT